MLSKYYDLSEYGDLHFAVIGDTLCADNPLRAWLKFNARIKDEIANREDNRCLRGPVGRKAGLGNVLAHGEVAPSTTYCSWALAESERNQVDTNGAVPRGGKRRPRRSDKARHILSDHVGMRTEEVLPVSAATPWTPMDDGWYVFYAEGERFSRYDDAENEMRELPAGLFCVLGSSSGEPVTSGSESVAAVLLVSWSDAHLPECSADGGVRVFFGSGVPLVAQDANGRQDVHEWEREGTGDCEVGSGVNAGCVYLLSGGTSEGYSWFVGASESRDDVFMAAEGAQLVSKHGDGAFGVYEARVGGAEPMEPFACTGMGCEGVWASARTVVARASVMFDGVGGATSILRVEERVRKRAWWFVREGCVGVLGFVPVVEKGGR